MHRFPIGFKLITAFVALVAALTAGFVWTSVQTLGEVYEEQSDRLQGEVKVELRRRSVAVARGVGQTAREALAGNEIGRLQRTLRNLVEGAPEIRHAAIADDTGRILVRSDMLVLDSLKQARQLQRFDPGGPVVLESRIDSEPTQEIVHPIRLADGSPLLGYLMLAWGTDQLGAQLAAITSQRDHDIGRATAVMLLVGAIAVGAGILVGIMSSFGLTRPIRRLAATAQAIAAGDFTARAEVTTRDEIGDLAVTMNDMADQIGTLLEETRRSAELTQELTVARGIQEALLPTKALVRVPGLHVCGLVEPASHCGGDWWAYLRLTRQRTLVLVGDVTGHGISSAMVTATARSCLDTVHQLTGGDFRVGHLLKIMDQLIRGSIGDDFHMTCFASILDPIEGSLTYANAGHNHPYILRRQPDGWRLGRLAARGNRLGDADGHAFVEHTVNVSSQDLLFWYTDGLVEVENAIGRPFGERRLRRLLQAEAGATPDRVLETILGAFEDHRNGAPLTDDVTAVVGRIVI